MKAITIQHLLYKLICIGNIFPQLKNLFNIFYQRMKTIRLFLIGTGSPTWDAADHHTLNNTF